MTSTNYRSTLIAVSEDCPVERATPPTRPETIAAMQFALLRDHPYAMTSDELLLAVDRARIGQIDADQWARKPRACLRASPLVKTHGYGLHHDDDGRVAVVPLGSDRYRQLLADPAVNKVPGMRNARRR